MLNSTALVMTVSLVLGQAANSDKGSQTLQEFGDAVVGRWVGDIVLVADMPGMGKQGDTIAGYASIQWILDKKAIQWDWNIGSLTGRSITVWDAGAQQIKEQGCDSSGMIVEKTVSKVGDFWVWEYVWTAPDGTKSKTTNTLMIEDDGRTHVHVGKNRTRGNEKLPDYRDVWRRVNK